MGSCGFFDGPQGYVRSLTQRGKTTVTRYDANGHNVDDQLDEYEYYAERFDPAWSAPRHKDKGQQIPPRTRRQIVDDLADPVGLEGGFHTTYRPGRYEEGWLLSSLRTFYDQALIVDVLGQVKGGKEANVYRCQGHPSTGAELLAAKVYRPRQFRNLRNDKLYRQGRAILTPEGRPVKTTDHRIMRAIGKKTAFGVQVMHTSWLMHEYTTLDLLYRAGGAVPRPIAASENAILMAYYGDEIRGAPTLNQVRLPDDEARRLFREVLRNVELMLKRNLIHGDLSPYNILYWAGQITLIDFPQVTDVCTNSNAQAILARDIERICGYFGQSVPCDHSVIANDLWERYVDTWASNRTADMSVWLDLAEEP
jgi:RIO kinase 1